MGKGQVELEVVVKEEIAKVLAQSLGREGCCVKPPVRFLCSGGVTSTILKALFAGKNLQIKKPQELV